MKLFDHRLLNNKADFLSLINEKRLSTGNLSLSENCYYYFYYKSYIYGFYKIDKIDNFFYYFKKKNYQKIYFSPLKEKKEKINKYLKETKNVLSAFKKKTQKRKEVYLQIIFFNKNTLHFRWCSRESNELFGFYSKNFSKKCLLSLKKIINLFKKQVITSEFMHLIFKKEGYFLYKTLIDSNLEDILEKSSNIYLKNNTNIPFNYFFDGKQYLFEKAYIVCHKPFSFLPKENEIRIEERGYCSVMMPCKFDMFMMEECKKILELFQLKKTIPFQSIRFLSNATEFMSALEASRWVHFIGHGKVIKDNFCFCLSEEEILLVSTLVKNDIMAPKVLIMSACHSLHASLQEWFFTSGGEILIGARGDVTSKELVVLFIDFYLELFEKKLTINEAFYNMRVASLKKEEMSCFHLELIGSGDESLYI